MQNKTHLRTGVQRKKIGFFYPTLDLYILKQFLIPLIAIFLVFIILFLIGDLFDDLSDFLENEASIGVTIQYFLLRLPRNICFILPISTMLACMYTMANFGKHTEVTAMRSSGISLFRCGWSIYIVGLFVVALNFAFNEKIVPDTRKASYLLKKSITSPGYKEEMHKMLTYRSADRSRTWFFKYFDKAGKQKGTTLKKYYPDGKIAWNLKAEEAVYINNGWSFNNLEFTPFYKNGFAGKTVKLQTLSKSEGDNKVADIVYKTKMVETPEDIVYATETADDLPSLVIYNFLQKTENISARSEAIYKTILYYRLAFPWSCLLAIFLGIPLAARNERSSVVTSIIIAIGVIAGYQLVSNFTKILGMQGYINPFIAGVAPTILFIFYGIFNIFNLSILSIFRKK